MKISVLSCVSIFSLVNIDHGGAGGFRRKTKFVPALQFTEDVPRGDTSGVDEVAGCGLTAEERPNLGHESLRRPLAAIASDLGVCCGCVQS